MVKLLLTGNKMATTFSIKKTKKGYCVIQKTKNVYTGNKTKISNLGCYKRLSDAKKTKKISIKLVK